MDPEQVILDDLAQPPGELEPGPAGGGGWKGGTVRGGPLHRVELGSVLFVTHRESSRRRVDFVTFHGSIPMLGHGEHSADQYRPCQRDSLTIAVDVLLLGLGEHARRRGP
jgi:hypothetical protein